MVLAPLTRDVACIVAESDPTAVLAILPVARSVQLLQEVPPTRTSYVPGCLSECQVIVELPDVPSRAGVGPVSTAGIGPVLLLTVIVCVLVSPAFHPTFQKVVSVGPPILLSLSFTVIVMVLAPIIAVGSATIPVF